MICILAHKPHVHHILVAKVYTDLLDINLEHVILFPFLALNRRILNHPIPRSKLSIALS